MKLDKNHLGYLFISLKTIEGFYKNFKIHRLVLSAFFGPSNLQVNHKDLDKSNNHISNLEYLSHRENNSHYRKSKNRPYPIGVSKKGDKFRAQIRNDGRNFHIGTFETPELAEIAYLQRLSTFVL